MGRCYHGTLQKGYYNHPLYQTWARMLRRCLDPICSDYHRYGGRGIIVCERWLNIENFISDMGAKPSSLHTLEREDNDGNYCPENCRWATTKEQGRNKRTTKIRLEDLEDIKRLHNGGSSYRSIASIYGVDHSTIYHIFKG